ncbi:hypothetical protein AcV5_007710 [Taiwanofungus camphoratus]|nr:hypothetical protein AcV5_007710 [Antrodia cinnamomea]
MSDFRICRKYLTTGDFQPGYGSLTLALSLGVREVPNWRRAFIYSSRRRKFLILPTCLPACLPARNLM